MQGLRRGSHSDGFKQICTCGSGFVHCRDRYWPFSHYSNMLLLRNGPFYTVIQTEINSSCPAYLLNWPECSCRVPSTVDQLNSLQIMSVTDIRNRDYASLLSAILPTFSLCQIVSVSADSDSVSALSLSLILSWHWQSLEQFYSKISNPSMQEDPYSIIQR